MIAVVPCADSEKAAERLRRYLLLDREVAKRLGEEALSIMTSREYVAPSGNRVVIRDAVSRGVTAKVSLSPDATLPPVSSVARFERTTIGVENETTFACAKRLIQSGRRTLALNFADGVWPGGGFLNGAQAQEESMARSSTLYATLKDDPMYTYHKTHAPRLASHWAILSPEVTVFRADDGTLLEETWPCSLLTCAAPRADSPLPQNPSEVMRERILRVLAIAQSYGYDSLVLGAWGCGAFKNDPVAVAGHFRDALYGPFSRTFRHVIFAIADWSPERRFLAPFRDTFAAKSS